MEGPSEVEFRRDAKGRPLLMEINPRLAGTLENAIHSGVDFPLMIWQWGTGQPIEPVTSYRTGVRTRWLAGDLRWLWESVLRGRPAGQRVAGSRHMDVHLGVLPHPALRLR